MIEATEVRQRPQGGLILTYPLQQDVMQSMLHGRVQYIEKGALDKSVAAINAGEQGFTVLWGADYNSPIGAASNGSARVALTATALIVTLRRYLDTAASRTVQALVSERVVLGVDLGIAAVASETITFTGPDGREWTRTRISEGAACEGRIRMQDAPETTVQRRYL